MVSTTLQSVVPFHCTVRRTGKEGTRIYDIFFYDCTLMVVRRPITIELADEKKLDYVWADSDC